VVVKAAGA